MRFLEEYFEIISPDQKEIVELLNKIVLSSNDKIKFQFKYGLPAYQYIKNICYFNCKKTGEVDIGFWEGIHLDNIPELELKDRKRKKTLTYNLVEDVKEELLNFTLQESIRIQEKIY